MEQPSVPLYDFGETGIPYNILVDPEGKIIAERLRGSAAGRKTGRSVEIIFILIIKKPLINYRGIFLFISI